MTNNLQAIATLIGILAFFAGIIIKWARDRRDTEENKKSNLEILKSLKSVTTDLTETKFDTKESNRLLTAVHKRLDSVEEDQKKVREEQIRHDEQIKYIKEVIKSSQKFKLPEINND